MVEIIFFWTSPSSFCYCFILKFMPKLLGSSLNVGMYICFISVTPPLWPPNRNSQTLFKWQRFLSDSWSQTDSSSLLTLYNPASWSTSCVLNRMLHLSQCLPFATCIIPTRTLNLRLSKPIRTTFMKRIILHEKEKQDTCWIGDWSLQWRSLGLVGQPTVQRWKCNMIKSDWVFH